jgi:outer membrane protein OmpA-like peptidoglycan-associated protein/opacity protein-like surface antigen
MRWGVRIIVTMMVAFVMVPALYADDFAKPEAKAKNDESPASTVAAALPDKAEAQPDAADSLSVASSSVSSQSPAGAGTPPVAAIRRWDEPEDYYPKVEWFLGYSLWHAMPIEFSNRMAYLHGGSTSIAYNFNRNIGLVADFGGYDNSRLTLFTPTASQTFNSNGSAYTYVFGPRFSYRLERLTPYFQTLVGGAHASPVTISGCSGAPTCTPLGSDNAFAYMLGGGLDIKVNRHVALRLFQADFLLTHFRNPFSPDGLQRGWQENARISTGVVFRFGGVPPPPPPEPLAASCSADREMVYVGSGDFVVVRAEASNPGQNPLNYSWSANEGAVDGTGPEVRWNSSDRPPGTYTIKVRVDGGRNGMAGCSVNVRVELRPNRPPTMSCSADRRAVTVGEPVEITAVASDPDNDPLSFSWSASGGRIEGSASSVRLQTAGLPPGSYTITGRVSDGRGGTADCAVAVEVQAAQTPAEVRELEGRLALHSIYFATARPTVANPTGGLVESQQAVLLSLAADFNRYLTFKPQAHLILEGHADRRGSVEYNKDLTERRVGRAKSFLVEHGVPDANIETRALGKEQNLDAEQVKQLVEQNPDLSNDERQRIESNLQVIVLANNRRVDISLDTTGQQSVRQYPFNAKDSLTLLSTQGGAGAKQKKPPAKKKTTAP